jgi:hypothetical protein
MRERSYPSMFAQLNRSSAMKPEISKALFSLMLFSLVKSANAQSTETDYNQLWVLGIVPVIIFLTVLCCCKYCRPESNSTTGSYKIPSSPETPNESFPITKGYQNA